MRELYKPDLSLHLYRARVVSLGKKGDDRIKVRIMPYMADYPSTEDSYLPMYPMMFKGQVLTCFTEKDPNKQTNEPDWVFVAATEDFTVGYVVGLANQFYTCSSDTKYLDSYGYDYIQSFISSRGLDTSHINYDELVIEKWCSYDGGSPENGQGGFVEMYNYRTGEKYIINSSGTCFIMQFDKIYMRVGSPSGTKTTGTDTQKFSQIQITADEISFKSDLFNVDAKKVVLGHHGLNVVGTTGSMGASMEGVDFNPVTTIQL